MAILMSLNNNGQAITLSKKLADAGVKDGVSLAVLHAGVRDRKSTRLNSSHRSISYAVFCLKKKNRCDACRIGIHNPIALRVHSVQVPDRSLPESSDRVRARRRHPALHAGAVALAGSAATGE